MDAAGVDVLFVSGADDICWLTGFPGATMGAVAMIVPPEGLPVIWCAEAEAERVLRMTPLGSAHIEGYATGADGGPPGEALALMMADFGWAALRLGAGLAAGSFPVQPMMQLVAAHAGDLVEAGGLIPRCRAQKSLQELGAMERAARRAERMIEAARRGMAPGACAVDLAGRALMSAPMGGRLAALAAPLPDAPYQEGDVFTLGVTGLCRDYQCPLYEPLVAGTPTPETRAGLATQRAALEAGLRAAEAGQTASAVAEAMGAFLETRGCLVRASMGGGVGLGLGPGWAEGSFRLVPGDETRLAAGMTLLLQPLPPGIMPWSGYGRTAVVMPAGPARPLNPL